MKNIFYSIKRQLLTPRRHLLAARRHSLAAKRQLLTPRRHLLAARRHSLAAFFNLIHFAVVLSFGVLFCFSFLFSSAPLYAAGSETVTTTATGTESSGEIAVETYKETTAAQETAPSSQSTTAIETAPSSQPATEIKFSGGYTKINMQEDNRSVSLSGGANVTADELSISAQTIELYGKDFRYVNCTGKVNVADNSRGITLQCPNLFYDRETGEIVSDGWIEIQDEQNDATLSGARFEYDTQSTLIKIQMMARIVKNTDDGPMICRADSIEFDNSKQIVTLKGSARINWNGSTYNATVITVDLSSYEITMEGSISGEVNG